LTSDGADTLQAGRTLVGGTAARMGAYGVSVVMSVASAAIVLRYLGAADFGRYATVFAMLAIVLSVADVSTANVGVREHTLSSAADRGSLLANLQGLRLVVGAMGVVVVVLAAVAGPYDDQIVLGAALGGVGLLLTLTALTLSVPLQADLRLVRVAALQVVRQAATVLALVALVAAGAGVGVLLGASIPAGAVLLVAAAYVVRGHASLQVGFDRVILRALVRDTSVYLAATAVAIVYGYTTIIVTSLVAGDVQTGYLGAAHRIWYVVTAVPGLLVGSAFPLLVRAAHVDRARLIAATRTAFGVQLAVGAGLAIVLAAGAAVAIDVVAGPGYEPSIPTLRIAAASLVATALIALGGYVLLALRRHRALLAANVLALVTTAVLCAALAERDGATGAALALLAGEALLAVAYGVALAREGLRPPWGVVPRVAAAAALAAVPGFALGLPALPAAVGSGLVYAAAATALGAVPMGLDRWRGASEAPSQGA
jgi:O-antigen/teichoic acid export membrane protein